MYKVIIIDFGAIIERGLVIRTLIIRFHFSLLQANNASRYNKHASRTQKTLYKRNVS